MGALAAMLMCAYTVAKVLRDSLFLSEFGGLALPYAYIGVAIVSAGFVWLESQVQRRFAHVGASRFNQYFAILFSAGAALAFPHSHHQTAAVFYLWTGSQAMLLLPHFWVLALDVWDSRRARHIFPILGGCGLIGGLAGGAFGAWALPFLQRIGLMWILTALLVLSHLLTRMLEINRAERPRAALRASSNSPWAIVRSSPYIRVFAVGLALSVIISTLVDFQFKLYIQKVYPDPHLLTQFLGKFYVGLNAAALVFQFGAAGWLMQRFGLAASTGLQPTAVMVFAPLVAISTGWWAVIAMRWIQGVMFQTLGKPSSEIYYAAIPPNDRRRIKPTIDTLVERWSDAAVGVLLVLALRVLHVPVASIAFGTAVIAAIWLLVLLRLNRYYGQAFKQVMSSRWLEPEESPEAFRIPAARNALIEAIQGADARGAQLALKMAEHVRDPAVVKAVRACLRSDSPAVAAAAIQTMQAQGLDDPEARIEGFLTHENEGLRRAAVRYLLSRSRQPIEFARRLLDGDDPALREHLVEALVEHPSEASGAITTEWIDARIASGRPDDLLLAAHGLGAMRGKPSIRRLGMLLANPDLDIRRAAILSATKRPSPEHLEALVDMMLHPDLAVEARAAVAAVGEPAIPALVALLEGGRGPEGQVAASRTLARIRGRRSIQALTALVRSGDARLRHLGLQGLVRARLLDGRPMMAKSMAHRLFLRDLAEYRLYREPGLAHQDDPVPEIRLLAQSYLESAEMALERALGALACWYDPKPLTGVFQRLKSSERAESAPALEYLSHILPRKLFRPMGTIFEGTDTPATDSDPRAANRALIENAWSSEDPWLRACAVRAARDIPEIDPGTFTGEGSELPLVRMELDALARARSTVMPGGSGALPAGAGAC